MNARTCVFCHPTDEAVVWSDDRCRVLLVRDMNFAGFCRVVWNAHVADFSDLDAASRTHVMNVVAVVERTLRELLAPDKINLASLGNLVPHLHWHVIPRYRDDSHFPEAVWAAPQRAGVVRALPPDFVARIRRALDASAL
ncbi:MAG TPA: HIT family protein [Casimicrobiaceae bacterium]|nr:HIT family protein [Casimicrobiaceae bacterium]